MKKKTFIIGLAVFILTCLFPPWLNVLDVPYHAHQRTPAGHEFILFPPDSKGGAWSIEIDLKTLFVEWAALAAITGTVWLVVVKPPWPCDDKANRPQKFNPPHGNPENYSTAMNETCPMNDGEPNKTTHLRGKLLVVDDEEGPRLSLQFIFKDEYDFFESEDGPTAIELVKQHDIDVVVTNIRMAGMSGIELLERLKILRPDIEVIIMTAYETNDALRRALQLGASDYINKPFDLATMRAAVSKAMRSNALARDKTAAWEKSKGTHERTCWPKLPPTPTGGGGSV